jgi:hypothetical protein
LSPSVSVLLLVLLSEPGETTAGSAGVVPVVGLVGGAIASDLDLPPSPPIGEVIPSGAAAAKEARRAMTMVEKRILMVESVGFLD